MGSIDFRMPWPPSVNTYYICIRSLKVLSKKGREYAKTVTKQVADAGIDFCIDVPVEVEIKLAPPKNGIWDGDNYTKAIFDALVKSGVLKDDSIVMKYSVEKLPKYALGEVYISIWKQ